MSTNGLAGERRPVSEIRLRPGAHIHLMGICGTAMASLAGLLKDRGFKVTGSDQNVYPPMSTQLERIGIQIMEGYKRENLAIGTENEPELVIVGNVITRHYEEAQALLESSIPFTSLPAAMGELVIENRHSVVIAGTHGKTTTTSLCAWITDQLGLKPGFLIGGIPKNFDVSYRVPVGDWFVIEGDEYDTAFFDKVPKFIHYRPRSVILTSVEFDHADIYKDLEDVKSAFMRLLMLVPENGILVTNAEDENIADLLKRARANGFKGRLVTFGLERGDYVARNIHSTATGSEFEVYRANGEKPPVKISIQLLGEYNVKNALAAFALMDRLGFEAEKVAAAIASFTGVKRRQEIIGRPNNITIIEDFAHHPTAVKQTICSIQSRYPEARVFSVFEPRSATSRRKVFQDDYAEAFSVGHSVLIAPPFNQTNIPEDQRFSSEKLVADLIARGVDAKLLVTVDEIVSDLKARAKPGDVILVMSNGGFGGIYEKLLKTLSQ